MRPAFATFLVLTCGSTLPARDLVVQKDAAPLRAQCSDSAPTVALLDKGARVRLRFSLAGANSQCYSVTAESDGKKVAGYLSRDVLAGVEQIDELRRSAAQRRSVRPEPAAPPQPLPVPNMEPLPDPSDVPQGEIDEEAPEAIVKAMEALEAGDPSSVKQILASAAIPASNRIAAVTQARAMLQMTRPNEAMAALEPALKAYPEDPALLGLAGMSSFQQDRMHEALQFLRRSLQIEPNASLQNLYRKIEREVEADSSDEQTYGMRFSLRYEGEALPEDAARTLTKEFDREINRISFQLGCQLQERVPVIVQRLENYQRSTGAAEWSGGRFDGRIHIAVPPSGEFDEQVRQTFAHEFVHACLARKGLWPAWLHEGLAQKLSGRQLGAQERDQLTVLNREGALPSLERISGSWNRLGAREAAVAYMISLAAAQILYQDFQDYGVRNLLNDPSGLPRATRKLQSRLSQSLQ